MLAMQKTVRLIIKDGPGLPSKFISAAMKKIITLILIASGIGCSANQTMANALAQPQGGKSRITIASGVRLRATPATTGEEVTRLPLGTIVPELEQSASK